MLMRVEVIAFPKFARCRDKARTLLSSQSFRRVANKCPIKGIFAAAKFCRDAMGTSHLGRLVRREMSCVGRPMSRRLLLRADYLQDNADGRR